MTDNPRQQPLKAEVVDERLVVSIGLDALDALRKHCNANNPRISAGDIADYLVNDCDHYPGAPAPMISAIVDADNRAAEVDFHAVETEPDREFWR